MLHDGRLDLGLISTGSLIEGDLVVPGISISGPGKVGSVMLYSDCRIDELGGKVVRLSSESCTSNLLLRLLCSKRYGVEPEFVTGGRGKVDAELMIGDKALAHRKERKRQRLAIDMASEWHGWTSLPMVFAVMVARRADQEITDAARRLIEAKDWGLAHLREVARASRPDFMTVKETEDYIANIDYTLGPEHLKSVVGFRFMLKKSGLIEESFIVPRLW
jgi:chorismate dehydratase